MQSDASELVGGYKPVELQHIARPLYVCFTKLFSRTFSLKSNGVFLKKMRNAFDGRRWKQFSRGLENAVELAQMRLARQWDDCISHCDGTGPGTDSKRGCRKRAREAAKCGVPIIASRQRQCAAQAPPKDLNDAVVDGTHGVPNRQVKDRRNCPPFEGAPRRRLATLRAQWSSFAYACSRFERQRQQVEKSFAFAFVEGALVRAMRLGWWILLDEVNLASAETLERLSPLLRGASGTLVLTERGDVDALVRHPEFRIFAAMNPATDFGKKDLPPALRSLFTEIYVDEIDDEADLQLCTELYLEKSAASAALAVPIVQLYMRARSLATVSRSTTTTLGQRPGSSSGDEHSVAESATGGAEDNGAHDAHPKMPCQRLGGSLLRGDLKAPRYSLRTLSRALRCASSLSPAINSRSEGTHRINQSLYEAF